jgi:hypothetical protein
VSKASERKKARRRKRQVSRDARWIPADIYDELAIAPDAQLAPRNVTDALMGVRSSLDDGYPDDVVELVREAQGFERRLTQRGWTFDSEFSRDGFASWFFEPSGSEPDDEALEPVTRVWLTVSWDDQADPDAFPSVVNVLLVGSGEKELSYRLPPEDFLERIDVIESYRIGDPHPLSHEGCDELRDLS